jgi:hypothetical protein
MQQHELLIAAGPERCAYCAAGIASGARAWWVEDDQAWACTTCVPTEESDAYSVGYSPASARESNRQKIAAASFLR